MNAQQSPDTPEDDQPPARTPAAALRELRALQRAQRARERGARERRHLGMLTAQSERRRAPGPAPAGLSMDGPISGPSMNEHTVNEPAEPPLQAGIAKLLGLSNTTGQP